MESLVAGVMGWGRKILEKEFTTSGFVWFGLWFGVGGAWFLAEDAAGEHRGRWPMLTCCRPTPRRTDEPTTRLRLAPRLAPQKVAISSTLARIP